MIYETKKCISEKVKVLYLKHIFAKSFKKREIGSGKIDLSTNCRQQKILLHGKILNVLRARKSSLRIIF